MFLTRQKLGVPELENEEINGWRSEQNKQQFNNLSEIRGELEQMKKLRIFPIWVLGALFATGIYATEPQSFTITGERIVVDKGLQIVDISAVNQLSNEDRPEGSTSLSVVVTRTDLNSEGLPVTVEVASSSFEDGKVLLEGTISERTSLLVSVDGLNEEPITMKVVVDPGESLSFVLLDYISYRSDDKLLLVGDSRLEEGSDAMFKVSGDLSSITDKDLSVAVAELEVRSSGNRDDVLVLSSEAVLLRDGKFSFEGIVREPLLLAIDVTTVEFGMRGYKYRGIADVVVEPGARIRISPSKSSSSFSESFASELMAYSDIDGSMHAKVVESWQNSASYLEKMDQYANAIKIEQKKDAEETSNESVEAQNESTDSAEIATVDPYSVYTEMEGVETSVLSTIAQDLSDPIAALLAMELGAPEANQLEVWDKLIDTLDGDIAERRAVPRRKARESQINLLRNSKLVIEGHMAPEFTLSNLKGEEITLYDALADNEVVLVNFWASWCGPCIVKIPKIKELYSEYKDDGFEMVFVAITDEYDDWKDESDRQEFTWINVGDLDGGWHAQTAIDYGVQWIPTEFAVNADGEILDRDLTTDELEEFLASHFGRELKQESTDELASGEESPETGSD